MRALVVSNMAPDAESPARGVFVRDQVAALRRIDGLEVDLYEFPPGGYLGAARELWRRARPGGADASRGAARGPGGGRTGRASRAPYDVVHAHFGLTAWPSLALRGALHAVTLHGTDVRHPRSNRITRAALPFMDLVAAVSDDLAGEIRRHGRDVRVLPCGVALDRFRPLDRREARERLDLDPDGRYLLFPADPARPGKRHDRAMEVAGDVRLLTATAIDPRDMPLYVNAANAVLVPSDAEGFGLAVLEALACDVPVLATPVGVHREALRGVGGTLCAPYAPAAWRAALRPHLDDPDPRIAGRAAARPWSADAMARRVADAWADLADSAPEA
jgi:teichuronic acid biosynthesis glycosyltransferase TuaC